MNPIRCLFPAVVAVAVAFAASPSAHAQSGGGQARVVIPYQAYPGDHVFVPLVGGGDCNAATLDPARPPQVRRTFFYDSPQQDDFDVYRYAVSYWLRNSDDVLCGVPPPAPELLVDVGALPRGSHHFTVTGHLGNGTFPTYDTTSAWVHDHQFLPSDISGLWRDPAQSGRGLSVIPISYDNVTLFWATHDQDGRSLWLVSTQAPISATELGGLAYRTSGPALAPGPSVSPAQPWGQVKFTYVGCGRARFEWTPIDTSIPAGSQTLLKLAQSVYEPRCAPPAQAQAVWID